MGQMSPQGQEFVEGNLQYQSPAEDYSQGREHRSTVGVGQLTYNEMQVNENTVPESVNG